MSLKKIKSNLDKIKKNGDDYFSLDKKRDQVETKIKQLKSKYREGRASKDIFSRYNKELLRLVKKMEKIREDVGGTVQEINNELQEELQDVIS